MIFKPSVGVKVNRSYPLAKGLLYAYNFNEGGGQKAFEAVRGRPADFTVAPTWVADNKWKSLNFNGTSQYLSAPNTPWNGGPITVIFWSNTPGGTTGGGFSFTNPAAFRIHCHSPYSDNKIYWDYGDHTSGGRLSIDYTPYLNKWTQVVLTAGGTGGTGMQIFFNGLLAASNAGTQQDTATGPLEIGRSTVSGGPYYHNGKMGLFLVYNRVLTASEIRQLYIDPFCFLGQKDEGIGKATLSAITATLTATIGSLTLSSAAAVLVAGSFAKTIGNLTLVSAAGELVAANGVTTFPPITLSAAAAEAIAAAGVNNFPPITVVSSAAEAIVANLSASVGLIGLAASSGSVTFTFAATIPPITSAASYVLGPLTDARGTPIFPAAPAYHDFGPRIIRWRRRA